MKNQSANLVQTTGFFGIKKRVFGSTDDAGKPLSV